MRRHDIDWLRVIAFILLIFYHVAKFFEPDDFHIKNNITYDWLELPMYFLNRWRMPLLFVISGIGTFFALDKRNGFQFSKDRFIRLFIPLVFGMMVIIPPQVYIERFVDLDFHGSYFEFWTTVAFDGEYPKGNLSWHHLWFLPYLLLYTFVWLPFFYLFKKGFLNQLVRHIKKWFKSPIALFVFCVPLILIEFLLKPYYPTTHALNGDWYDILKYGTLFGSGFFLMSIKNEFFELISKYQRGLLYTAFTTFGILYYSVWIMDDTKLSYGIELFINPVNYWSWILVLFSYAAKYLNKPSKSLAYANEAVYPFYILHQTLMLIIGFYIMNWDAGFALKFSIMTVGTFISCLIIYVSLIKPIRFIRPFFGLKLNNKL